MVGGEDVPVFSEKREQGVEIAPAASHAMKKDERRTVRGADGAV
jgi:hypothetical protein